MNQNVSSPKAAAPLPPYTVETWPIGKPKKYERNARTHSPKQLAQLRDSFRKFGQVWPILVREDGTIIAGHGRLEAAKAEGMTEIRVIVATGWTEEQCRAFGLLDNRVALASGWDETLLAAELAELSGMGVDLAMLGFEPPELSKLLPNGGGLTDPDDVPEAPAKPVSRVGDLWVLGRHRLLCGDSTKAEDVARVLAGVKPHLMVTDPPYGVNYDPAWRNGLDKVKRSQGKVANDDRADWREVWALFPGAVAYVWHSGTQAHVVAESLTANDFQIRAQIIWAKPHYAISRGHYHPQHEPCWYAVRGTGSWNGSRKESSVWQISNGTFQGGKAGPEDAKSGHSTQKPVECMKRPIENNSSPGQAVYDPFVGSGTTIIAAEMTDRSCHVIDIDPAYVDVCIKRWQDFTGQQATLDGDGRTFAEIKAERERAAA